LLDLFSTCSRHLFRTGDGMATAVLGGAVLFASVKFLSRAEPRAYSDSRRYQKTRFSNAHRTVAADSEFHVPYCGFVFRLLQRFI
jgi:hypothetical protein